MTAQENTWVLVTGASSGFGKEFARQYAAKGRSLILVARRLNELEALAEELRNRFAVDVMVKQADLSSINVIVDLHRDLHDRHIVVDVLINNAGYGLQGAFLDEPLESSLAMINLDVASLTAMTRLFAEDMRARRKGHILMVASLLSYQGVKHFAVYSAAKAFVLRFSDALHRELKPDGVVVTALCPGMSDTGFAASARQKITPALKGVMMQPQPVVQAGIDALHAGRMSVVPGLANKLICALTWATPRRFHQRLMAQVMGV
ncbi:SDR family NAD(P)-dependent oxidoreductase [Pseudomonas sp. MWU12-2534b]|uniref:SDR family NAD(P)-dependent oxidoreductase n=1 Tax=Pseudomonas fluorescens TaxID=294 RepID=UPI0006425059|nr:SDR family oxidoreductase [Pseudomonas fluorescens]RBJ85884.1 SDR family NAD(P)-dependent oxidoreductase [Pseudomonas sp. MWU12-2534b]